MSRFSIIAVTLAATLAAPPEPTAAAGRLSIRVTPATSFAPASLSVRILLDRNTDDRWMRITIESDEYFRSSDSGLDEKSPRLLILQYRDLPAGEYDLYAEVFGPGGRIRTSARTSALIVG